MDFYCNPIPHFSSSLPLTARLCEKMEEGEERVWLRVSNYKLTGNRLGKATSMQASGQTSVI
jgi:hypothetical protein